MIKKKNVIKQSTEEWQNNQTIDLAPIITIAQSPTKETKQEIEQKRQDYLTKIRSGELKPETPTDHKFDKKKPFQEKIKNRLKRKFKADCVVGINMELNNGDHKTMIVTEKDGCFIWKKCLYIFDDDAKYYNMDMKLYCFDFHQSFAIPFKRKFPLNDVKTLMKEVEDIQVEYMLNPKVAHEFSQSRIAEGIMQGANLPAEFKKIVLLLVVGIIGSWGMLLLFVFKSGMLQSIKIPGING